VKPRRKETEKLDRSQEWSERVGDMVIKAEQDRGPGAQRRALCCNKREIENQILLSQTLTKRKSPLNQQCMATKHVVHHPCTLKSSTQIHRTSNR
jgi:hypothetical protein